MTDKADGARPSDQALASQAQGLGPSGFDPSRYEFVFEADSGTRHKRSGFLGVVVGWPGDDGLWWLCEERRWVTGDEASALRKPYSNTAPCRSFKAFKSHVRRHAGELGGRSARLISRWVGCDVTAIAMEAGTDETERLGPKGDSAGPQGIAPQSGEVG